LDYIQSEVAVKYGSTNAFPEQYALTNSGVLVDWAMAEQSEKDNKIPVRTTASRLTFKHRWDHFLARWGVNRKGHRVVPGLYALGEPDPSSPVFVTANYTLSFDALRGNLAGKDAWILVLNTRGINVWCAAGKGTFGTTMLAYYIRETGLDKVVNHRRLILPQLGATGVSAHEVKRRTGFSVEYGPIRAEDISEYLRQGKADEKMRTVRFNTKDRAVLIPVEFVASFLYMLGAAVAFFFLGGWLASLAVVSAFTAGTVLFPLLLPWIPTRDFSSKGFILGGLVAVGFALAIFFTNTTSVWWIRTVDSAIYLLLMPPVTAFLALNFTGSTTFTSKTGVRKEMFAYIPVMAWLLGAGVLVTVFDVIVKIAGIWR
jgi:hypothetical protein